MATRISSLIVKLTGDTSGLVNPIRQLSKELQDAGRRSSSFFAGFNSLGGQMKSVGSGLTAGVTLPLGGLAVAALKVAGDVERAEKAFTRFAGSTNQAKAFIKSLQDVADKSDLTFDDLLQGSRRITTFAKDSADATRTVKILTDAIAGTAGSGENFDSVARGLQQIAAKGKLSAEEINQLSDAGVNVGKGLADALGISQQKLQQLTQQGLIPADLAIKGILQSLEKDYGGAAAAQADSLLGIWSTVRDQANRTAGEIGTVLAPTAKRILTEFIAPTLTGMKDLASAFGGLGPGTQNAVLGLAGVAAAAGPLVFGFGSILQSGTSMITLFRTLQGVSLATAASIGVTTLAVGALAAAVGYYALEWYKTSKAIEDSEQAIKDLDTSVQGTRNAIIQRGGDVSKLDRLFKEGRVSAEGYGYALANMLVMLTKQQGPTKTVADNVKKGSDAYEQFLANIKKLGTGAEAKLPKIPEWAKNVSVLAQEVLGRFKDLTPALQDAVKEEGFQRQESQIRSWATSLIEGADRQRKLIELIPLASNSVNDAAIAYLTADNALHNLNETLKTNGIAWAQALVGVRRFKTSLEDFGLRSAGSAAADIADLTNIIEQLKSELAGDVSLEKFNQIVDDIRAAEEKLGELQGVRAQKSEETGRRQQESLIQVSTVATNLGQSLAKLALDGGKFGEVMVDTFKQIGRAIVSNFIEKMIVGSGLIDKASKGLGGLAKNIPGIGKLGSIFGGGASAAGGVASASSSVGGSAASALVSSGLASTISAVTGVVSAVTGVIGLFQGATTNKRLGQLTQTAQGQLNQAVSQQETFNLFLPVLPQIHDRLKQIIANGLGVFSQNQSVVRAFIVGGETELFGGGALERISGKLDALPSMLDRLNQIVSVGIPVYNATFQPALRVEGGVGGGGAPISFDRSVIAGGPYQGPTLDWLTDEIAKRLQARGGKA